MYAQGIPLTTKPFNYSVFLHGWEIAVLPRWSVNLLFHSLSILIQHTLMDHIECIHEPMIGKTSVLIGPYVF